MADFNIVRQLALQKKSNKKQSNVNGIEESVLSYKDGLDLIEKERYIEKIRLVKGQDPYEIVTWSRDNNLFPNITYIDIINYLVFKPSPYTAEELRCYKGLDAYNQFVNGWVRDTGCCIVNERCILTAKVLHSQRLSEKPLRPWVISEKDGQILTAHCTCMAGLGEACSHVAALLFYIEAAVKIRNSKTCTDVPAYWKLPATFKQATYEQLRHIDFSSASTMKKRFDETCVDTEPTTPKPTRKTVTPPDQTQFQGLLHALSNSKSKPAILSLIPEFNDSYVPIVLQSNLPDVLTELYNEESLKLDYNDLIKKCASINVSVTKEQSDHVEFITRQQSSNRLWYRFRSGRVTASRMKAVCCTNPAKPALSVINSVCYPESVKFTTNATKWGCSHENTAREMFLEIMIQKHDNVRLQIPGFIISEEHSHIGASPDAIMTCDCCGTSPVEIKCPFCKKDCKLNEVSDKKFCLQKDSNNELKLVKNHSYYYQLQTQMGVMNCESGYFVVWTEKDLHVEMIMLDTEFWIQLCHKSLHIFKTAMLPELVGKFFSRVEVSPDSDNHQSTTERLWCYCQDEEYGDMVECENPDCSYIWFHYECLGLKTAPRGQWFCPDCRKMQQKRRRKQELTTVKKPKKC